jgi:CDP-diacylglycerol--serine O-phosphatidyltransferase
MPLLPNAFTTAALFCGFFAVIKGMNGQFEHAALAIFTAMVFDGLDGRVARMTNTQSSFGAEYDSLSDMLSFGVAPGLLAYEWGLKNFSKVGWMICFIYTACAAIRLARFNTSIGNIDKRFFQGLASPSAAALVASFIWSSEQVKDRNFTSVMMEQLLNSNITIFADFMTTPLHLIGGIIVLISGLSMVSDIPFYSFKTIKVPSLVGALLIVAILCALIAALQGYFLFLFFFIYLLSGFFIALIRLSKGQKVSPVIHENE